MDAVHDRVAGSIRCPYLDLIVLLQQHLHDASAQSAGGARHKYLPAPSNHHLEICVGMAPKRLSTSEHVLHGFGNPGQTDLPTNNHKMHSGSAARQGDREQAGPPHSVGVLASGA